MTERGATITMADMVAYYDNILKNGRDLPESSRRYLTELRDTTAAGTLVVPDGRDLMVASQNSGAARE